MTVPVSIPQARVALGWVMVNGVRTPVEIDMEWMLTFTRMLDRTGGVSGDTNFSQYINQFFDAPLVDTRLPEALRAVDELRQELSSTRSDVSQLRGMIDELTNAMAAMPSTEQFRSRIETIEGRLA